MSVRTPIKLAATVLIASWQLTAIAQDAIVPDDFASIAAAVAGASDVNGNGTVEIFVRAGTYAENVLIQRSNLTLTGQDAATTVIQGSAGLDTLHIEDVTGVRVQRFTITNPGPLDGIDFTDASNCVVTGNILSGGGSGISMNRTQRTQIVNNDVSGATGEAIRISDSSVILLRDNLLHDNLGEGLAADNSQRIIAVFNDAMNNGSNGFRDRQSSNDLFVRNRAIGNGDNGFYFEQLTGSTLRLNTASNNVSTGLRTKDNTGNLVTRNVLTNNLEYGIRVENSGDDFSSAAGVQAPPGDNTATGNVQGNVRID